MLDQMQFRAIRRHKILSKSEWEMYLKVMPRETINEAFTSRILLTPTRDSKAITTSITKDIIDGIESEIKKIIFEDDSNYRGVIYISKPDIWIDTTRALNESDKFKSASVSIFFGEGIDSDRFYKAMADGIKINGTLLPGIKFEAKQY